jgi:hypothetical protein
MQDNSTHTGWGGWVMFASIMMVMLGAFQFVFGLTALLNDEWFLVSNTGLTVTLDYTTWGWIHLGLGLLIAIAGSMLLTGSMFGRVVGILVALGSAVTNAVTMPAYPLWSVIIITLDIVVIYTLAVHGADLREPADAISLDDTRVTTG